MTELALTKTTCARLPKASLCVYANNQDAKEPLALVMGDVERQDNVLVRLHSECFTNDVLGSLSTRS